MPLDHTKASVTISVAGLAILRPQPRNHFEFGFLKCDRHDLDFQIHEIEVDPDTGTPLHSACKSHSLSLEEDILIDVFESAQSGGLQVLDPVVPYEPGEFNRLTDLGDPEDFRWIIDLEGPEFHNQQLQVKVPSGLMPTVVVSNGTVYTKQKTSETFGRYSVDTPASVLNLGKVANGINTDIICPIGGEVILSNRFDNGLPGKNAVSLQPSESIRYLVSIENHCHIADESDGTDFRLFYDVLEDFTGKKFDLRRIVKTCSFAESDSNARLSFALDGYPQNCLGVTLGGS